MPEIEELPRFSGCEVMMFLHEGKTIGMNSLKPINNQVIESGLMIDQNYHKQGLCIQYMKEIEEYVSKIRGFKKIISFVCESDTNTLRRAEICGFEVEGRLKNFTFYNGKYEGAVLVAKGV